MPLGQFCRLRSIHIVGSFHEATCHNYRRSDVLFDERVRSCGRSLDETEKRTPDRRRGDNDVVNRRHRDGSGVRYYR